MRAIYTTILAIAALLCSCTPNNRYIIEGTTAKADGDHYYLFNGYELVDSALVTNGKYRFEGEIDSLIPTRNIGSTDLSDRWETTRFTPIILEAGTIRVEEDDNSITGGLAVSGTKGNNAIRNFALKGWEIQQRGEFVFSIEQKKALAEEYNTLVTKTINKNLDNFASLFLLSVSGDRFTDSQKAEFLDRLSPAMKRTTAAEILRNNLETNN